MNKSEITEFLEYRDGDLIWKVDRNNKAKAGQKAGFLHNRGYWQVEINGERHLAHRLIFFLHYEYWPEEVDHINGNKLDNRIENLRPATRACNEWNQAMRSTNTSGVKNVDWHKAKEKWRVRIRVKTQRIFIGHFDDLELAKQAAIKARSILHGEFANHGII